MDSDSITGADGAWGVRNRAWIRLSLRLTLAGLLAFAIGHLLHVVQPSWAVLTALIVTQASVGGALKAAVDRFVGSLGGAAWGVATSLVLPHATLWELALTLTVALTPLAVLTALRPVYRIAPITAVILLLAPASQTTGPLMSAVNRLLEIGLGSAVALGVAFLVLPERAHGILARTAARALDLMGELTTALVMGLAATRDAHLVDDLNARIRKAIITAETIAEEVTRERRISAAGTVDPQPLCRALRRLHNDLAMVGRASIEPLAEPIRSMLAGSASNAGAAIATFLRQSGQSIVANAAAPSPSTLEHAMVAYAAVVADLRRSGLTRALSDDDVGRLFGLTFALEQLRTNLRDLADRADDIALATKG